MVGRIRLAGAPATVKSARHNFASGTNEPSLANVRHSRLQVRQAARLSSPKSSPLYRQATADPEPLENRTVEWRIRSASRALNAYRCSQRRLGPVEILIAIAGRCAVSTYFL